MPKLISLTRATDGKHKYQALFEQDNGRKKTVKFGAAGMTDYTLSSPAEREARKTRYLARHAARESWNSPMTAGACSRWILWNLTTVQSSLADYRRRFAL